MNAAVPTGQPPNRPTAILVMLLLSPGLLSLPSAPQFHRRSSRSSPRPDPPAAPAPHAARLRGCAALPSKAYRLSSAPRARGFRLLLILPAWRDRQPRGDGGCRAARRPRATARAATHASADPETRCVVPPAH